MSALSHQKRKNPNQSIPGTSLWDGGEGANTERFQGSVPLLPDLCSLSVP